MNITDFINEINKTSYFIIRNDGIIIRNGMGSYVICTKQKSGDPLAECKRCVEELNNKMTKLRVNYNMNSKIKKLKNDYTFNYVLIDTYLLNNPNFKF